MTASRPRTVRDPVWGNLRLPAHAAAVVDTPEFQRLRRVKQLGFAHLVYPGAVHTRFLHALGVFHLTRTAIDGLRRSGALELLSAEERERIPVVEMAALLHDVGHYAFSHAMEEVGPAAVPAHHEEMAARFLEAGPIRSALRELDPGAPEEIARLIRGASEHPLQGLVAGSLDLDKIDYLRRDGHFCGVPYGALDAERLLDALTLARQRPGERAELAVTEKGVSALESLLFSKYQMFRNVYWHHAVRAATVAFRRMIEEALAAGLLGAEELPGRTDEELLAMIGRRAGRAGENASSVGRLVQSLTDRRLPKRALELFGDELPDGFAPWIQSHPELVRTLEERLAEEWGLPAGCVFLDYPAYPRMLDLRILLVRSGGEVRRLTSSGEKGLIDLPRLSRSLHHAARVFRVFVLGPRLRPSPAPLLELLEAPAERLAERLEEVRPIYA